ncbi:M42 family metallopeptidase [Mycolicibacterium sp. Dal123E01]|uniref:M42 family metallopeptidase n=1 Tax=Mycolicibacterium sp. Dal123E01 TaxID=3457578 RepID=UPI00403ECA70
MKEGAVIDADHEFDRRLLQELLWAYGPCGQEQAVRDICLRELTPLADETWIDKAGNAIGLIRGTTDAAPIRLMAHMDELSMLVKRIDIDGTLHLTPLGTMYPANFGLGPVAVLGRHETLCAVLSLGSEHTTKESPQIWQTKPDGGDRALDWPHVYVFTGRTHDELTAAGVHPGTRVCIDKSKRTLIEIGRRYLGSYFMDDRACVTTVLQTARRLREHRPASDTYVVFTTNEEVGGVGGAYASANLPGDLTIAVEVGPTAAEYGTTVNGGPIIAYSDALSVYDKDIADQLIDTATELDLTPQAAVLGAFESDASHAKAGGLSAQAGLVCLPTLSTHGYEVISTTAIPAASRLLATYLVRSRV